MVSQVDQILWQPLLEGKFGPMLQKLIWLGSGLGIKARTPRLGTYQGGFQACVEDLTVTLAKCGVTLHPSTPIKLIKTQGKSVSLVFTA